MRVILCICGERLEGSDDAELFEVFAEHTRTAHADLGLNDEIIRTAYDQWVGNEPWDGERRTVAGTVEVKPLGVETLDDFLAFFDRRAFMDNPVWFGCYCMEPHGVDPDEQGPEENRADKIGRVKDGTARGFLAYVEGEPVGWCNAAPRSLMPGVVDKVLEGTNPDPDEQVGAIACFTIAVPYRGSGVGTALLQAACDGLREQGFGAVEAYPRKGELSEARSYRGPLSMYGSAGFTKHGETETHLIVRKSL